MLCIGCETDVDRRSFTKKAVICNNCKEINKSIVLYVIL